MSARICIAAVVLSATVYGVYAGEVVRMVYRGEAIRVQLQVGSERHLVLASQLPVTVGVPHTLSDKLSVTAIASQVWLLAHQSFENEKIILKTPHITMVLELSAAVDYPPGRTLWLSAAAEIANADLAVAPAADAQCDIGMVSLARYALQWAYAPRRLLRSDPCIRATDYPQEAIAIMNCLDGNEAVCGGGVVAKPIAAWRTAKLYASLLELKNTLLTAVSLDPRAVVGDFKAAALAHHRLEAANTAQSVTALLVIGDKPLSRSIPAERWIAQLSTADR